MENNQYNLCIEVLSRLDKQGVLKSLVLVGSWCIPFYKEYFSGTDYTTSITTRDIDLFVPLPFTAKNKVDVESLIKDLGFIVEFKGPEGYIRFEHPDLILEFLVSEKGAGLDKPYKLPQLGANAQRLRFLNLLTAKLINVKIGNIKINLPHPAVFALHKLIISEERINKDKKLKDRDAAVRIIRALLDKGEVEKLRLFFFGFNLKLRKRIIEVLKKAGESDLSGIFDEKNPNY